MVLFPSDVLQIGGRKQDEITCFDRLFLSAGFVLFYSVHAVQLSRWRRG